MLRAQAYASLVRVTVAWSTPTRRDPNPFAGTAVFQYDPADAVDFDPAQGLIYIPGIPLISLAPDPLSIGSVDFTASSADPQRQALASVFFRNGHFDELSVYGAPGGNNNVISSPRPDFQVVKNTDAERDNDLIGLRTASGHFGSDDILRTSSIAGEDFFLEYQVEEVHEDAVVAEPASVIT
jgi:hypothetical protein